MFLHDGALSHASPERLLSRRQLFHASDLARALKVAQQAGLTIARVEIEPSGKTAITRRTRRLRRCGGRSPSVGRSA